MSTNPRVPKQPPQGVIGPAVRNTHEIQREAIELNEADNTPEAELLPSIPHFDHPRNNAIWTLRAFWRRQVSIVVAHDECRDHFANERTYLAYLRTSSAFATLGTTLQQLFRLQNSDGINSIASPYGEALAVLCLGLAVIVALSGACRFWRQQNAMVRAKAHAGGWEPHTIGFIALILLAVVFIIILLPGEKSAT